jgi:NADPH:quinone reductase-like Zn-dependent oxidoreductase
MNQELPSTMSAVYLTGHGGIEVLQYREDVPLPQISTDEVLIRVAAAGVNNTDINTRIGWYSKKVSDATASGGAQGYDEVDADDATWSGVPMEFPRISYVDYRPFECWTLGSECDGAFAQFVKAPARETFKVECDWSDAELASIPCAYSTAENMLHRAAVGAERVLVTGASGGVGSAAVQLAKRRGAHVIAVASITKADDLYAIGADQVIDRNADLATAAGRDGVDVVIDLVAGDAWPSLLDVLRRGGRYATAGAIAGPMVELDVRTLYLKDLTFIGCTFQDDVVFENLVGYIEANEIKPLLAQTFPLQQIGAAQELFLTKKFTGKLVLIPPV